MKHVLTAAQFTTEELEQLFAKTDELRSAVRDKKLQRELADKYRGSVVAAPFYEPSTRTRLSFETAAARLGAAVVSTENAREFSSAAKGETIEDSTRVLAGYVDVIIMRHHETGAAERAAQVSPVPVINAGDGLGGHPTQALLDLYTIKREAGRLNNLRVVIGGDLKHGRTVRSLARLLCLYPANSIAFVSTLDLRIDEDIKSFLRERGVTFSESVDLPDAVAEADVVYWTRLQKERLSDPSLASGFIIDEATLKLMKPTAVLMHPLPRVDEISTEVDGDPRAAYFRQAANGLYVRMALLDTILSAR